MSKTQILKGLQHPLLLLIIGALISSIIIPSYTRQWQDHQKVLELKTNLVSEISDAVSSLLIKTQTTKAIASTPYKEFYDAYETWESASAVVESKLDAYFYGSSLPQLWSNYSSVLGRFAFLSISNDLCMRAEYVESIRNYLSADHEATNKTKMINCESSPDHFEKILPASIAPNLDGIDWKELVENGNQTRLSYSWQLLKQSMVDQKDRLIQEVLQSNIQAFS